MKTSLKMPPRHQSLVTRLLLPGLVIVTAIFPALASAAEPQPGTAEPKTHTLFMGADVYVEQDKEFYRVEDVVGGSFVIKVKGKEVGVPSEWGAPKLKSDHSLKLTATSVTVDHLKADRVYTPGNDPRTKFAAANNDSQTMQGDAGAVALRVVNAQEYVAQEARDPHGFGAQAQAQLASEQKMQNNSNAAVSAASGMSTSQLGAMQDELAEGLYDALDVEFDASSDRSFQKPYVVVMVQYHEKGSKPGESHSALYAMALKRLDSESQKVRIHKSGFPRGFELEKFQVHVYDGGKEFATSMAENQVRLTRTEAFTYLLLDYLGSHKGATLPAAPAMGRLSAEEKARLSADQLSLTYRVKVTKDGLPVAAFTDERCSNPADAAVGSLIANVRFYPALEKGKAVEGVAELRFHRLAL